jgi:sugar lactone lactonase YvrE
MFYAYLCVCNKVVYKLNTFALQGNDNSSRLFVIRNIPCCSSSNGQHISTVSSIGSVLYIHHRDNSIYYTDYHKVYCIKKDGSNVFTFISPDLIGPYGIDTDRQGNVYVVGWGSNNILRLSPDGQNSDIITKEDGISNPLTLCFSGDFKKLFVSIDIVNDLR